MGLVVLSLLAPSLRAQEIGNLAVPDKQTENRIKAAYIYNIMKFVRWPSAPREAALQVCVFGDNVFGEVLGELESRQVQGYTIQVRPMSVSTAAESACQVVYVALKDKAERLHLIESVSGKGVVTISDADGFVEAGGIIGFVRTKGSIRFELNMTKARAEGLVLSSQLAATALKVR